MSGIRDSINSVGDIAPSSSDIATILLNKLKEISKKEKCDEPDFGECSSENSPYGSGYADGYRAGIQKRLRMWRRFSETKHNDNPLLG